uniref:Uncharacterized protein n=1 Tax=Agrobacterium tumefaciens TaxID=358 RepID=A0A2P0QK17_AGRTU|nr:putative protein VirH [Agrobacterium tumefaciens]
MPGWNTAVGYKTGPLAIKAASPGEEKVLDSCRLTGTMYHSSFHRKISRSRKAFPMV